MTSDSNRNDSLIGCPCPDCSLARIAEMRAREEERRKEKEREDSKAFFERVLNEQKQKSWPCGRPKQ